MSGEQEKHDGVFLVEGGQLSLSNISSFTNDKGELDFSSLQIKLRYDVCPEWLEIAMEHLESNSFAAKQIQESLKENDDNAVGEALKKECRYGMQSIVASCTAMEAFIDVIKELSEIPADMKQAWRKNRTSKYARTAEIIKIAFNIKNEKAIALKESLKEAYSFRDRAIHPNQKFIFPGVHPELNKAVDFTFVLFRHHNAKAITHMMLSLIHQLITFDKIKNENVQKYSDQLLERIQPLVEIWQSKYENLHEKS